MPKHMIIDGIRVEFTDERNILQVSERQVFTFRPSVTIQIYQFTVRAVCALLRMRRAELWLPALPSPTTKWL